MHLQVQIYSLAHRVHRLANVRSKYFTAIVLGYTAKVVIRSCLSVLQNTVGMWAKKSAGTSSA